jgi:transmembrane sensor
MKPSQAVRAEAAAWIARLHGPDRTNADEESFRRWLAANASHAVAFERMTTLWEAGTRLKSNALAQLSSPGKGRAESSVRFARLSWVAAGIAAVAIAGSLWKLNGAAVTTRVGEQRTLTLDDGTRMTLNTATRLEVRYDETQRRVELQSGEALFEVKAQSKRPFVVVAAGRQITALGTSFIVRRDPEELSVTLVEGKVKVMPVAPAIELPATEQATVLIPGQRLTVARGRSSKIDHPTMESVTAWRQGVIAMDRMPLTVAVAEMNRYSEIPLAIDGLEASSIEVSGVFKAGDSLEFAHALARSHGLHAAEDANRIVLSKRRAQ